MWKRKKREKQNNQPVDAVDVESRGLDPTDERGDVKGTAEALDESPALGAGSDGGAPAGDDQVALEEELTKGSPLGDAALEEGLAFGWPPDDAGLSELVDREAEYLAQEGIAPDPEPEQPGDEAAAQAAALALATIVRTDKKARDEGLPEVPTDETEAPWSFVPLAPKTIAETGIPEAFLRELLLKVIWAYDKSNTSTLVNVTGLHGRVIDELIEGLNREGLCEIDMASAQTKSQFEYRLSDRGKNAAHEALDRSRYVGVAPVPVNAYNKIVEEQMRRFKRPPLDEIREALAHLVLPERLVEVIGQAFFSRRALMVYGPSGNGKTDIVTSIARVVAGTVIIPYSLYGHGQLIRVFDPDVHKSQVEEDLAIPGAKEGEAVHVWAGEALRRDRRWLPVSRPTVVVGGDMGAEALDMTYDATQGVHNAPLSIVAQGGVLVIDDLGRQRISPKEILNRWVLMMEQGYDSFALGSSEIVRLPLDVTLVFSTNLTLQDLMDEAYLRRIAYKIAIPGPDKAQMLDIARRVCEKRELKWTAKAIEYLVERCYGPGVPEPKGCYPRDIITTVIDEAEFQGRPAILNRETIDTACALYFGAGDLTQTQAA